MATIQCFTGIDNAGTWTGPNPCWARRRLCLNRPLLPCLPEASACSGSAGFARFAGNFTSQEDSA